MDKVILSLLIKVSQRDEVLAGMISRSKATLYIDKGMLVFSLEGLYQFLADDINAQYFEPFCLFEVSFQQFKKQVYQSRLNQQLASYKIKVDVFQNTGKIDSNLYCLTSIN